MKKSNFLFLVIVVLCSLFYPSTFVEAKEGVYTLNIAAELIEKDGKNLILAKGEANFPDNTQVNVRFRDGLEPEICYATKKVNIKSGRFECLLNLSDRKTLPGKYIVEARISPLRQARKDIVAILGPKGENIKEVTEGELEIDEQTQRRSVRAKFILRVGSDLEIEQVTKKEKDLLKELVIQLDSLYKDLRRQYALQQEEPQMNRWDSWSRTWLKKVEEVQKSFEAGYSKSVGFKFFKLSCRILGYSPELIRLRQGYSDNLHSIPYEKRNFSISTNSTLEEKGMAKNLKSELEDLKEILGLEEKESEN